MVRLSGGYGELHRPACGGAATLLGVLSQAFIVGDVYCNEQD